MTQQSRPRTAAELEELLEEKRQTLHASCASFDRGVIHESKRLAVDLRVLLHDTNKSVSLLAQLGLKSIRWVDTAHQGPANGMWTGFIAMEGRLPHVRYVPLMWVKGGEDLHSGEASSQLFGDELEDFDAWWSGKPCLHSPDNTPITRRQLMGWLANKDGGAHVDPDLDLPYDTFRTGGFDLAIQIDDQEPITVVGDPVAAALRQMAYEVELSLSLCDDPRLSKWGVSIGDQYATVSIWHPTDDLDH